MASFFNELRKRLTAGSIARFNESLHPRDAHGRFSSKPGGSLPSARTPSRGHEPAANTRPLPQGWAVRPAYGGQYSATGPSGEYNVFTTLNEARTWAQNEGRDAPGITPARSQTTKRYPPLVMKARQKILSGRGSTRDRWSREIAGERVYSRERQALHEDIIDAMLRMVDGKIEPDSTKRGPRRVSARDKGRQPRVFFTGGGYAGGKGGVVDYMNDGAGHDWKQELEQGGEDPIVMDPDKIKALIPEFAELRSAGDPEANLRVYEEAWDIAQELVKRIQEEGHDVVMDGVGNTSEQDAIGRAQNFLSHGYAPPKAVYVTTPVEVAVANSRKRMEDAIKEGKLESIRYIPEDLMQDTHGKIAQILPGVIANWPGELELYDTNTRRPDGGFDPPVLILKRDADGNVVVHREDLYQEALARKRYATS